MEKTILVTDKDGHDYPPTYLRRAKGLVKNGRAYWIDALTKLCLICPPMNMEGNIMSDTIILAAEAAEAMETIGTVSAIETADVPTCKCDILARIDAIIADNTHLHDGFESINRLGDCEGLSEKTAAISDIVKAREATNQKLIELLEKML